MTVETLFIMDKRMNINARQVSDFQGEWLRAKRIRIWFVIGVQIMESVRLRANARLAKKGVLRGGSMAKY